MPSAHLLRLQIETALSARIPSALTPAPRVIRPTAPTGIAALDERLGGGLPIGAISELTGPECSGRTSLAVSFVAGLTEAGRVCAWVDVSDALDPESAAAIGVDLDRLLWVRCGAEAQQLALPGFEANPKIAENCPGEASVLQTVSTTATNSRTGSGESLPSFAPRCAEPQPRVVRKSREAVLPAPQFPQAPVRRTRPAKPWSRLDQALRVTDLLLQAGGFSAVVLDMGGVAPEFALRVPLATWFRYRAAAERTQASVVLLTQRACTKSSAGVVLTLTHGGMTSEGATVLTGAEYHAEIARERFGKVAEFARKPPQSEPSIPHLIAANGRALETTVRWQSFAPWAGRR